MSGLIESKSKTDRCLQTSDADQVLCVISIPPMLEHAFVDWLLERDDSPGFSSAAIHGHSSDPSRLTAAEKVSGRQRRLQFQVQMPAERLEAFTAALAAAFRGTDLHYWVLPLLAAGSLRSA